MPRKTITSFIAFILSAVMLMTGFTSCSGSTTYLTVDGNIINEDILNYYIYISKSMLEIYYDSALDYTTALEDLGGESLGTVVKDMAYQQIIDDYAYLKLVRENNLEFTEDELPLINEQVDKVISNIGSKDDYVAFLKDVGVSDSMYRDMLYNQLLIKKAKSFLCSDDGPYALTDEEIEKAKADYSDQFVNVEYILLSSYDLNTGDELDSASLEDQRTLAKKIRALAYSGSDFHKLIDKYSSDKPDPGEDYNSYIKSNNTEIPEEFTKAAFALKDGDISSIVSTDYGFYIIKRLPFDDYFSTVIVDTATESKLEELVKDTQSDMTIVNTSKYSNFVVS